VPVLPAPRPERDAGAPGALVLSPGSGVRSRGRGGRGCVVTRRIAVVLVLLAASIPAAARGQEAADPYRGGERAQDLVVWITGAGIDGAGVVFGFDGRYASVMTAAHVIRAGNRYVRTHISPRLPP